jgi:NTP pyrophosphatase (non-canonical NTP hydrolase)
MVSKITDEMKDIYIRLYKQTYSVSEVMKTVNDGVGRGRIVEILKKEGIYEGLKGPNYLARKVKKHEELMMRKYGVVNWGQTKDGGYKKMNKVPYRKISYLTEEAKEYRKKVDVLTRKNIKEKYGKNLPKYCYYTGIMFADEEGQVNPNDPRKRSVDHKIPVLHCFLKGISIKEAAAIDNIVFVLKYVNSIKAQSTEESIAPIIDSIRRIFINEGFISKENFKTHAV